METNNIKKEYIVVRHLRNEVLEVFIANEDISFTMEITPHQMLSLGIDCIKAASIEMRDEERRQHNEGVSSEIN
tara:strand:- start:1003 stop:1224 length:222 start_codon:yes stop_codon:yes gene_type:complete